MNEKTEIIEKDESVNEKDESVNEWILYVMTKIAQKITDEQEQDNYCPNCGARMERENEGKAFK